MRQRRPAGQLLPRRVGQIGLVEQLAVASENSPARRAGLGVGLHRSILRSVDGLVIGSLLAQLSGQRFPAKPHFI